MLYRSLSPPNIWGIAPAIRSEARCYFTYDDFDSMKSTLVRFLLAAVLGAGVVTAASAARPSSDQYKSWLIVCDNALTCEAKGFTEGAGGTPDLRFIRGAGSAGWIGVRLSTVDSFALDDLHVDGRPLRLDPSAWKLTSSGSDGTVLSTHRIAAVEQMLTQLRNGTVLQVGEDKDAVVPLDGLVAALLRMDDRQGRIGGVTALVRKGATPASMVPPPPVLPRIPERKIDARLSGKEEQSLLKRYSAKALAQADGCEKEAAGHGETAAYALDVKTALVLIPCVAGAYQTSSDVYLVSRQNGVQLPLHLPAPDGKDTGNSLMEPDFNPETGTLSEFDKGRGVADCGAATAWIWDSQKFQLSSAALQTQCGGSSPGDFPTIYRSTR
ncbi:DUF1176 domain-containing protein [Paraburkholderia unamae]|nr:DUF1176 domain-containing protein [Paraburkholderia unamae]